MATEFPIRANTQSAEQSIGNLVAALRKTGAEAGMAEKEIDDMVRATSAAREKGVQNISKVNQGMNNLGNTVRNVAAGIAALVALDQLKNFAREIINITAEFQKFEAVLTNTLGSQSAAQIALRNIQEFAAKTPFSVRELTESFVSLANQGFKPTQNEMRKLGDLAASTGKSFGQLTEAIIDAQTGEFERLKEFGIRATKQGEAVTFSFKGVQTQTEFTSEAMRNYVLSLGDAVGVSGSMAAISGTVGGQISNMGDAWNQLLNTIGSGKSTVISTAIRLVTESIQHMEDVLMTDEQLGERTRLAVINASLEQFKATVGNDLPAALEKFKRANAESIKQLERAVEIGKNDPERLKRKQEELDIHIQLGKAVEDYVTGLENENKKATDAAAAAARAKKVTDLEKEAKARNAINEKLREYMQLNLQDAPERDAVIPEMPAANQQSLFSFLHGAEIKRLGQQAAAEVEAADQKIFDHGQQMRERDLQNEIAHQNNIRNARQATLQYTSMAVNEFFRSRQIAIRKEMDMLQMQYNHEMSLAGENDTAKRIIMQRFDQKRQEIFAKQARQEQIAALFSMAVNQGQAIVKAIATAPFPVNLIIGGVVAAMTALQISNVARLQQPRFAATGEFDIDGPGNETSDSIPYYLSKRESVVPARGTKKFGDVIKPIIENPDTDWLDIKRIVDMKLPGQAGVVLVNPAAADQQATIAELRAINNALARRRESLVKIDRTGFAVWMGEQGSWRATLNQRYGN